MWTEENPKNILEFPETKELLSAQFKSFWLIKRGSDFLGMSVLLWLGCLFASGDNCLNKRKLKKDFAMPRNKRNVPLNTTIGFFLADKTRSIFLWTTGLLWFGCLSASGRDHNSLWHVIVWQRFSRAQHLLGGYLQWDPSNSNGLITASFYLHNA